MGESFRALNLSSGMVGGLSHRSVGSNPCNDTCVLEQDAHTTIASLHTCVPVRTEMFQVNATLLLFIIIYSAKISTNSTRYNIEI